jgi:hypothetical protein
MWAKNTKIPPANAVKTSSVIAIISFFIIVLTVIIGYLNQIINAGYLTILGGVRNLQKALRRRLFEGRDIAYTCHCLCRRSAGNRQAIRKRFQYKFISDLYDIGASRWAVRQCYCMTNKLENNIDDSFIWHHSPISRSDHAKIQVGSEWLVFKQRSRRTRKKRYRIDIYHIPDPANTLSFDAVQFG